MFLGSKSRTAGAAICLLVSMFLSPFVPVANAAAPLDPHTLYFGVVTTTPIQSMADINQLNIWGVQTGALSQFDSVLNVRPFYYLSSNDTFIGDFAQSYEVFPANDTYIVHYRTGSSWTNGDPLNAWDAYATAIILTGLGCPAFNYKVLNNYTLSIQIPHNPAVALDGISVSSPVFAIDNCAVGVLWNYKQYLPLVQQVLGNYSKIQSGDTSVIQKFTAEIIGYKTSEVLYNGAYYPTSASPSEIILSKNPGFWDAKNLLIDKIVVYQFTSNTPSFSYLTGGELSVYYTYGVLGGSATVPDTYKSSIPSYMKEVNPQGYAGPGITFNNASSFVSDVHVRRAIAYALNRTEASLTGGTNYSPVTIPLGLPPYMWDSMCPASCQSQLNPYDRDLTKAASEMTAAGYVLTNGAWTSKNGTQVKLTLVNSVSTDVSYLALALDIQTQLANFGIGVNLLNPANPGTYATSGTGFDMYLQNWGFWVTPWDAFRNLSFMNGNPYPVMHFLGNVTVPGYGSITATALQYKILNGAKNVTMEANLAAALSYVVNTYLPYLPIANQKPSIYLNTQQFNWPAASSDTWSEALVNDFSGVLMLDQEHGLLTLASTTTSTTTTSSATTSSSSPVTSTLTTTAVSTTTAISTTTATSTAISTSVATSTVVSTTSANTPAGADYTLPIVAAAAAILVVGLAATFALRRRPAGAGAAAKPSG